MPKFRILNRKTGKEETRDVDQDSIILGRGENCSIVLNSKAVSRKHTEIVFIDENYFIADLESGNGTFLNGRKLRPFEKNLLQNKDQIRIEEFEITPLFPKGDFFPEEKTDSGIIEIKMIKKVLGALNPEKIPNLEVLDPPALGVKVKFPDNLQELLIGRDADCNLTIDSDVISRRHAIIQKKWGGVSVKDLDSKNGTFVNNKRVDEKAVKDGDEIKLGNIRILFRNPQEIDLEELSQDYERPPESFEPEAPEISDEAKASLGEAPEEPQEEESTPQEETEAPPEEDPHKFYESLKPALPPTSKFAQSIKSSLTLSELLALALGLVVLIGAVVGLVVIF